MKGYKAELAAGIAAYKDNVDRIVESKYFHDSYRARRFVDEQLGPVWATVLDLDDPESITNELELTDTLVRVIHFYALGVLRFRERKFKKAVFMTEFPPTGDEDRPVLRSLHKKDVARIVGRSLSAVEAALLRVGGNKAENAVLHRKRILYPMPVATGVMLDVMTQAQLSLMNFAEFDAAKDYAIDQAINQSDRSRRTTAYCRDKTETQTVPTAESGATAANDSTSVAV